MSTPEEQLSPTLQSKLKTIQDDYEKRTKIINRMNEIKAGYSKSLIELKCLKSYHGNEKELIASQERQLKFYEAELANFVCILLPFECK